jgi:putative spermidine/putrescine transport system ATP-binding protein
VTATLPRPSVTSPTGAGAGAAVAFHDVTKQFAGHRALTGLDLELQPGELVAVLGPSGCGKTTALRSLAGLEDVSGGRITIDGRDVVGVPTHRRDVGMVFQAYSLFPHLTVRQNVEFGLRMRRVDKAARAARAGEMLDLVGLGDLGERYAHQLSGGQQQRVALARDEPLSALDAKVRVQLRDEIRRIQRELSITTLFVTHDQEEALAVADRVAVMRAGSIEQVGTPEELYSAPATAFVAEFVGTSNRVSGEVIGALVRLAGCPEVPVVGTPAEGPVWAYVRPEDVSFVEQGGLAGVVESVSFLGAVCRTRVRVDRETLLVLDHRADERREPGAPVRVSFTPARVAVTTRAS